MPDIIPTINYWLHINIGDTVVVNIPKTNDDGFVVNFKTVPYEGVVKHMEPNPLSEHVPYLYIEVTGSRLDKCVFQRLPAFCVYSVRSSSGAVTRKTTVRTQGNGGFNTQIDLRSGHRTWQF